MGNYRVTNSINSSSLKENAKILACLDETRVLKNTKTSNLARSTKTQPLPLTPAKKRSSLARPVRVHDSFAQPRKLLPMNYAFQTLQKASESTYEEDDYKETGWPIRLRLEQMLELTLPQTKKRPKKKTPMMLMKQQQTSRHACKDTERLLRVLSVNNVDQDTSGTTNWIAGTKWNKDVYDTAFTVPTVSARMFLVKRCGFERSTNMISVRQ